MSRTLARLRAATGDPLLVRAGRGLVPTPRATELRDRVHQVVQDAQAVLRPTEEIDLAELERTFTLRTREGFVETFGPALMARVHADAPRVRLWFVQKPHKESGPLREGVVDLETGVVDDTTGPELRTQALFRDRFIGVVRSGHPLCKRRVTQARYTNAQHVAVSRREGDKQLFDAALEALGLPRKIEVIVDGFSTALALSRASDLIASVPARHTEALREGMHSFRLPFTVPELTVSLLWHPRLDADPAHRWLRTCVREVCASRLPPTAYRLMR